MLEGEPCIVLGLDRKVTARIRPAQKCWVKLKDFRIETPAEIKEGKIIFGKVDGRLVFTKAAIDTALGYITESGKKPKNFFLETSSKISLVKVKGVEMKPGFGSSAAAVVAISGAVLKLHGIGIRSPKEKGRLFKIAIIAHYLAQGKIGSGFDVAASVFGGATYYRRFGAEWLQKQIAERPIKKIVDSAWPGLEHRAIKLPKAMEVLVGFTGKSASTRDLVQRVSEYRKSDAQVYSRIISNIGRATEVLGKAIAKNSRKGVLAALDENRKLLKVLSEESMAGLETGQHKLMSEIAAKHGAVAKFSGAGGGDCGIGVCFDEKIASKIRREWKSFGIVPINATISDDGVK